MPSDEWLLALRASVDGLMDGRGKSLPLPVGPIQMTARLASNDNSVPEVERLRALALAGWHTFLPALVPDLQPAIDHVRRVQTREASFELRRRLQMLREASDSQYIKIVLSCATRLLWWDTIPPADVKPPSDTFVMASWVPLWYAHHKAFGETRTNSLVAEILAK